MNTIRRYAWYLVSVFLLGIYLTYFHLLNGADAEQIKYLGAGFGSLWLASCFIAQTCFRNRFEFAIHTLITLDFFLEAMVPFHSGYSFYVCAASFWVVFWVYHHLPLAFAAKPETEHRQDLGSASI